MNQLHPFVETISVVGAVGIVFTAVIVTLVVFFRGISWITGKKPENLSIRGVIAKTTVVTVHMVGDKSFEKVQFVGFTSAQGSKAHLPWGLEGMVILENEEHQRYLVRAKDIKMIVVPPVTE
jgi:hypothetical protein